MSQASKYIIAIIAVIAVALGAGYLGAGMRGGGGSTEASGNNGAWLQKIRDEGELRVGVASAPPMTAEQEDGTMGGPNILPLEQLADEMGVELVTVAADWGNMVAGLQADRFDVAAYLDATSERALAIQFTEPVYTYTGVFAVPADSGLYTTEDVVAAGTIATASGSVFERTIADLGAEVLGTDSHPNAVTATIAGRADAALADLPTIADAAQSDPNVKVIVPDPAIYVADSNYGVSEDIDARSMNVLNIAIRQAQNNGSLDAAITEAGVYTEETLGDLEMAR